MLIRLFLPHYPFRQFLVYCFAASGMINSPTVALRYCLSQRRKPWICATEAERQETAIIL
jgi:hypothetical protein